MNIFKKVITSALAITVAIICISDFTNSAHSSATGAPSGRTGSPGDNDNCTSCHSGSALTTTAGLITSNIPSGGYVPGNTYSITATISAIGVKFGFEVSPQNTNGDQKGTLVTTSSSERLLEGTKYITHLSPASSSAGTKTWTFDWVAPAAGSGNATFYGAFVAANDDGGIGGDQVFLSNLLVQEDLTIGITDQASNSGGWLIYPNPATDKLFIQSLEVANEITTIEITEITGKRIRVWNNESFAQIKSIDIADLQNGMYVLNIHSEKGIVTTPFLKN